MTELSKYLPITEEVRVVALPCIPEGKYAQDWARAYNQEVKERFNDNPNLVPNDDFSQMNFFKALLADEIAKRTYKGRVRVALPNGLDDKVVKMVRNRFYTIPRALAFRDTKQIYERNRKIADELAPHIEQAHGKMPKYAMVSGLVLQPWQEDKQGYQLKVLPTKEFAVLEDDRFSPEFSGWYFTEIDEYGLPKREELTREQGSHKRRWFTSDSRLTRFGLDSYSVLYCGSGNLADSGRFGRVALVRGKAAPPEILQIELSVLEKQEQAEIAQIRERGTKVRKYIRTGKLE